MFKSLPLIVSLAISVTCACIDFLPRLMAQADAQSTSGQGSSKALRHGAFAELRALIKPQLGEGDWEHVPWAPSSDIWAARQKAAAECKPLFLWYMAGEPLGAC